MTDLHIDDFYRDSALIFLRLYSQFPRKIILYVDDICGADTPDEYGLPSDRYQACFSAMVWLGEQGYLSHSGTIRQTAIDQAVLSEKGFLLLSSRSSLQSGELEDVNDGLPPSVIEESQSNIMHIRRALKSGSSIMIAHCMRQLLDTSIKS
jgi:hypothetical protein